jgi:pentatricopeptide repeat protein
VTKWMLSKGQGRTMGSYFTLLNALAEDGRLDEAEELWTKLFMDNLESTPRVFFDKMISIYHKRGMHEKMFEVSLCHLFLISICFDIPILLYMLYMKLQIILFFLVPFPFPWGNYL